MQVYEALGTHIIREASSAESYPLRGSRLEQQPAKLLDNAVSALYDENAAEAIRH
jgi:hypothetical protein